MMRLMISERMMRLMISERMMRLMIVLSEDDEADDL